MSKSSRAVEEILDQMQAMAVTEGQVSVADMTSALGDRGWGPFLFIPAIIEISPLGGVPGVPTILSFIIIIFAMQIAWGRERMWLPGFLGRRAVSGKRMGKAIEKMRPVGKWLDRWFHARLPRLVADRPTRVAALLVILLCLMVPPLEFLPFASTAPMAAIAMFGLALMLCDGLLMAFGFALAALAGAVTLAMWVSGGA